MPSKNSQISIVFWGTPEFALHSLDALFENGYNIVAVVTNPDELKGRKQVLTSPPVKVLAEKYNLPVLQPQSLKSNFPEEVRLRDADLYIVAAYGKIIPKEILDIPKHGALNIHPSLLPRWRGPSPMQYTILNGDKETGVTIMLMDEKMDYGPAIAAFSFQLPAFSRPTYKELHDKLAKLGAGLLIETLPRWLAGKIKPVPQDESKATYSKILKKEDGKTDWTKSAEEVERQIRAFSEWPGSYTFWQRGANRLKLEIEEAEVSEESRQAAPLGFVWQISRNSFFIQCGVGSIAPLHVRLEGRKSLSAEEFLNGYRDIAGTILE